MHGPSRTSARRLARFAALSAGLLLLAGCATGYNFVQPEAAGSGGYYTGEEPYTGEGYYDVYGTGPYYPGTSGWGYYSGSFPFAFDFGYGSYWGYGYSPWVFNVGISSVWDFPGYWGPWYSVNFPIWGCGWDWGCGYRHHHWHGDHHPRRDWDDTAAVYPAPHFRRDADRPGMRPRRLNGAPPIETETRSAERIAAPRPLDSAGFAQHGFVRAPIRREGRESFAGNRAMPGYAREPSVDQRSFATRREIPMPSAMTTMPRSFQAPQGFRPAGVGMPSAMAPRNFSGSPQPAFRSSAPAHFAAPAAAAPRPSRSDGTPSSKIR